MQIFRSNFCAIIHFIILLSLLTGCKKEEPDAVSQFPNISPTAAQLSESKLHQFITHLDSMPVAKRDSAVNKFIQENPHTPIIENNTLAGIYWYGSADMISINGDLQHGWRKPDTLNKILCGENSFFSIIYSIPSDTRVDYLLYLGKKEVLDERNPRITPGAYSFHSEIAMPGFKSSTDLLYRKDIKHGTFDSIRFSCKHPEVYPRTIMVYKPYGYKNLTSLPTLYIYDGLEYLKYGSCKNVLDNLIAEKKIEPVIAVFIENSPADNDLVFNNDTTFIKIINNELVPLIDARYKTDPKRRGTAGISIFGSIALLTTLSHPETFNMAAGQSATITDKLIAAFDRRLQNREILDKLNIYLDAGKYDLGNGAINDYSFYKANNYFHEKLTKEKIRHTYHTFNDGHQWANWRERIGDILTSFFAIP